MNDVSPGKLTTIIGAAVVFLFSFLPWVTYSRNFMGAGTSYSHSAWSSGLLPMATWAPIFALFAGAIVTIQAFKLADLPEKVLDFTLDQIVLTLSGFTLLVAFSYLIVDKQGGSVGFGLIFCLFGAIAMVAGYFMDQAGVGENPNAGQPGYQAGSGAPPPPSGTAGAPQPPQADPAPQAPAPQPQAPAPQPPAQPAPAPQPPAQPAPAPPEETQFPGQAEAPPAETQIPDQPQPPQQPGAF